MISCYYFIFKYRDIIIVIIAIFVIFLIGLKGLYRCICYCPSILKKRCLGLGLFESFLLICCRILVVTSCCGLLVLLFLLLFQILQYFSFCFSLESHRNFSVGRPIYQTSITSHRTWECWVSWFTHIFHIKECFDCSFTRNLRREKSCFKIGMGIHTVDDWCYRELRALYFRGIVLFGSVRRHWKWRRKYCHYYLLLFSVRFVSGYDIRCEDFFICTWTILIRRIPRRDEDFFLGIED